MLFSGGSYDKVKQLAQAHPSIYPTGYQRTLHASLNFPAASGSKGFDVHVRCDLRNRPMARPPTETASSTALCRPPVEQRFLFLHVYCYSSPVMPAQLRAVHLATGTGIHRVLASTINLFDCTNDWGKKKSPYSSEQELMNKTVLT